MEDEVTLVLEPKLCEPGELGSSSLHLLASFDPRARDVAIALGGSEGSPAASKGKKRAGDLIYVCSEDDVPPSRRALFTSTYTVWTAVQRIAAIHLEHQLNALDSDGRGLSLADKGQRLLGPPSPETVRHHHQLAQGYLDAIAQYVSDLEKEDLVDATERSHGALLHHIVHLAQIVYIPADGRGDSIVGEEILDWVNRANIAPREEEAAALKQSADPFKSQPQASWDYLYRCVIRGHQAQTLNFLRLLHSHKDPFVADISKRLSEILAKRPRSTDVASFATSNAFLIGCRRWRQELLELQRDVEDESRPLHDKFSRGFLDLLAIAAGDESRILDRCRDWGWQDALAAWLTLVRPACTRDDLPEVMRTILDALPIDPTDIVDSIYTHLLSGNVIQAIQHCQDFDIWLAAHLTDLLDKLRLIDHAAQESFSETLRDYLTLDYADYLRSDPGLWRLSIDYLASCGPTGRARMRNILLNVSFRDTDAKAEADDAVPLVRDVLEMCAVQGLEDVSVAVCKIMSEHLSRQRSYGRAIAYCVRAGDTRRIARIADRLLDEYLFAGAAEFSRLVDAIPSSLLHPAAAELRPELFGGKQNTMLVEEEDDLFDADGSEGELLAPLFSGSVSRAAFASRLIVLGRLRDYIGHHARGELRAAAVMLVRLLDSGIAPKRIWAALLVDSVPLLRHPGPRPLFNIDEMYELLRCLEEITSPIATAGVDSIGALDCLKRRSTAGSNETKQQEALRELLAVRQALANNLARVFAAPVR